MSHPILPPPRVSLAAILFAVACLAGFAAAEPVLEKNLNHDRHQHPHNEKHPRVLDPARFRTSRTGATLALPAEDDAFQFVVYGDRTGGPPAGVNVLADAVRDTNLLEPDLVMTVGDLIQGYNQTGKWLEEMHEYKGIMNELLCPWFPVAGNHDTYWRGPDRPEGEHDASYELHFGPLWYAFEHKNCWFIALYSDEGNPETGEKNFGKPACQKMSPEQLAWLEETLRAAKGADHVFVFLHHPRWLGGGYGDDWNRVHEVLAAAGNVSAVFAGHIHRMRYDGPRDGIEYVTLATTGGGQGGLVPEAGWLHHYHVITVRKSQIAMAAVPVGEVMDVREITGEMVAHVDRLARMRVGTEGSIDLAPDGSAQGEVRLTLTNPADRAIDVTLSTNGAASNWGFTPDHHHGTILPGESAAFTIAAGRNAGSLGGSFQEPEVELAIDYLAPGFRYSIPPRPLSLPVSLAALELPVPETDQCLQLDGDDCVVVPSEAIELPDGPLTLECYLRANRFGDRVGLVAKTESSDYGIFVNQGVPAFSVFLGNGYVTARTEAPVLETGRWMHVAGVFDGEEVRLYVDGELVASEAGSGARRTNGLPLMVGADVSRNGRPMSFFDGDLDGVRLSSIARYQGEAVEIDRRPEVDEETVLLYHMDHIVAGRLLDASGREAHGRRHGQPRVGAAE